MFMQLCYEFNKKYFDLSLTLNSMSMANAEKSLEYTKILFFWSKYWANVKQLWALEILKYRQLWEQGPDPSFFLKSVLVMLVKHSPKEKVKKKLFLYFIKTSSSRENRGKSKQGNFGLGKRHFSRKRKQMLFICLVGTSCTQDHLQNSCH